MPRSRRPRGRGIRPIPEDIPVACWLPVKYGLNPHGMRHGHKTWMAEDGIPEILAEHRLGHEVPGMRGLYAHTSDRMREDLKPPSRPAGRTRSANGPPSTSTHPSRCSTNSWRPFAPQHRTQRHHETPSQTDPHREAGRR